MRRGHGSRFTPFQVGLIALVVIVIGTYLGASKDIPFTRPYELKAVFENAPPIHKGQAVRIAGVDVGKISAVEPVGGDSPAVVVTMKLEDEALPIHKDAQVKVRPRLFFEGNLFFDIRPGTPQAGTVDDGGTIPVSQTSAPVQLDQVLGTLTTNTREDLQKLLIGYGDALNGQPQPGEDDDQDPDTKGETAGKALNDSLEYSADALRGGAILNDATRGTELHDLSKLIGSQQKVFAALSSREGSLKDLITNFNTTMGALAAEESNLRATIHELPQVLEAARPALDNLNAAFPSTRAWALEMIPGVRETPATIDAGFPWIRQTRALLSPAELQGLVDDLQPAVADFAEFTDGQLDFLPVLDDLNRCQLRRGPADAGAAHRRRRALHRPAQLRGVLPGHGLARGRVAELRRQRLIRAHPGGRPLRGPDPGPPGADRTAARRAPASSRSAPARRSRPSRPTSRT